MILVRRLNGEEIMLNPHLIETIEATPDTVITLTSNKRLVVQDSVADLVARIIEYRKVIGNINVSDYES